MRSLVVHARSRSFVKTLYLIHYCSIPVTTEILCRQGHILLLGLQERVCRGQQKADANIECIAVGLYVSAISTKSGNDRRAIYPKYLLPDSPV